MRNRWDWVRFYTIVVLLIGTPQISIPIHYAAPWGVAAQWGYVALVATVVAAALWMDEMAAATALAGAEARRDR